MRDKSKKKVDLLGWCERNLNGVLIVTVLLILILPFLFSLPAFCHFFEVHEGHNVGDAIGGITAPIIGIFSILLLCFTLKAQKDADYRSALENRIFQMISLHRKNVEEMHSDAKNKDGQDVFKMIMNQINECLIEIAPFIEELSVNELFQENFFNSLNKTKKIIDFMAFAKLDIAYTTVYLGTREEYIGTLTEVLSKRYNKETVSFLVHYLQLKPVKNDDDFKNWRHLSSLGTSQIKEYILSYKSNKKITEDEQIQQLFKRKHKEYYWGHEFRLGHYYRHLFSSVKYIDSQSNLTDAEKYDYVKLLRTQLSNTEQVLFFANSISEMGASWELFNNNKGYISNYQLIKNIPQKEVFGISYQRLYPEIDYEFNSK